MLNSSYQDADLPSTENNSIWRLEVRDSSQQIIGQWRLDVGLGDHVLGPAERREFQIPWDGRTTSGNLVGPGRYSVSLQPEATGSSASTKATIEIEDAGPIVTVQQSDIDRDLASHQETMLHDERFDSHATDTQQCDHQPSISSQVLKDVAQSADGRLDGRAVPSRTTVYASRGGPG
jgi:hypothetical protein